MTTTMELRQMVQQQSSDFNWRMAGVQNNLRQIRDELESLQIKLRDAQRTRNRMTALEDAIASLREANIRYKTKIATLEAKIANQDREIALIKDVNGIETPNHISGENPLDVESDGRLSVRSEN